MSKKKQNPEYSKIIESALHSLKVLEEQYRINFDIVGKKNNEVNDLNHAIESEPHCEVRSKLSTRLHNVRKERRAAKDFVHDYETAVRFIGDNKPTITKMEKLLGILRKAEEPKPWAYEPRTLDDCACSGTRNIGGGA